MKSVIHRFSRLRSSLIASIVSFCFFTHANANTITVCLSGCGYTTIAAAMAAASSGDTLLLNVGRHQRTILFVS